MGFWKISPQVSGAKAISIHQLHVCTTWSAGVLSPNNFGHTRGETRATIDRHVTIVNPKKVSEAMLDLKAEMWGAAGRYCFDCCRWSAKETIEIRNLNLSRTCPSNGVLHHVAGISLLAIKDHILLMELVLMMMSLYPSRLDNNWIVGARWLTSDGWPSFDLSGFSRCVSITQCHSSKNHRSLTRAAAATLVLLACVLVALTSGTCEIHPCTIQSMLAGSVVEPSADDGVCIIPGGSMQQNLLINIHRKWLATVKGLLGPSHEIVTALEWVKEHRETGIVYRHVYLIFLISCELCEFQLCACWISQEYKQIKLKKTKEPSRSSSAEVTQMS